MTKRQKRTAEILKIEFAVSVGRCIRSILGKEGRGNPKRKWVNMTPSRYGHTTEMLRERTFPSDVVIHATNVINASAWLQKPITKVSDADVAKLLKDRPWAKKKPQTVGA